MSPTTWIDAPIGLPKEYLRFFDLFNARDFFEAHEVLEDLWVFEVGAARNYYKGLIMAAVSLEHWRRGNCNGARKLWRDGRKYLAAYPGEYEGFGVAAFIERMDSLCGPLLEGRVLGAPPDAELPVIGLLPGYMPGMGGGTAAK